MSKLDGQHGFLWRATLGNCLHFLSSILFDLVSRLLFFLLFLTFLLLYVRLFSRDQSSFFSSGEIEKKLVFEMNHLKAELVIEQVDLEVERQGHQNSEGVHTQVAKSEKAKKGHPGCFKRSI
jgi:hypothetical protein